VLLTPEDCLRICETPAATADLAAGRALEARHALHLDGEKPALLRFLTENKPELASPEAFETLEKVAYPATKPIYAQLNTLLGKVFTAQGRNFYFDFARPELADDFSDYLKDKRRTGQPFYGTFRQTWLRAAFVGFQGVYLVDLPATAADGPPAPVASFIPSRDIHDLRLSGDRIEYLVLRQELKDDQTLYFCYDDQQCHKVLAKANSYTYLEADVTTHGLGYVPACPVTTTQPDPLRPVRRTSPLDASLEVATVYLRDANMHEMQKAYHGYQKMWSYGVDCTSTEKYDALSEFPSQCQTGRIYAPGSESVWRACTSCKGQGKIIPIGPSKVYVVKPAPAGETSVVNPGPAGYITPELASAAYIGAELVKNEAKIEKAVLGKSGLLDQQKQDTLGGKILDWEPAYERFGALATDAEACLSFVLDTMATLRYREEFRQSQITLGRNYLAKSMSQLQAEYDEAKKAGLDDAMLYSILEDLIYTRWAGDPMELERNLLKLELTPVPTQTVKEAKDNGVIMPDDLLRKTYINDFFDWFENQHGSILEFASLLSHGEKINRIQEIFNTYLDDKRQANPAGGAAGSTESGLQAGDSAA
jgi:hypothetical protein